MHRLSSTRAMPPGHVDGFHGTDVRTGFASDTGVIINGGDISGAGDDRGAAAVESLKGFAAALATVYRLSNFFIGNQLPLWPPPGANQSFADIGLVIASMVNSSGIFSVTFSIPIHRRRDSNIG